MTHVVLFKMKKESDLDSIEKIIRNTYLKLDSLLNFIQSYKIARNCVIRDSNADIMIQIQLDTQDKLLEYLNHPVHTNMIKEIAPFVLDKTSFDYM